MARVERRHMGCVRAWRVCESHGLCDGMARVERRRTWAVCVGKGRVRQASKARLVVALVVSSRAAGRRAARTYWFLINVRVQTTFP